MRWKLGGVNMKVLAASYGIADIEPGKLVPQVESSPQTGIGVPPRRVHVTSHMRQQYEQDGCVVLSGFGC